MCETIKCEYCGMNHRIYFTRTRTYFIYYCSKRHIWIVCKNSLYKKKNTRINITIGKYNDVASIDLTSNTIDFNIRGLQIDDGNNKMVLQSQITKESVITDFEIWLLNTLEHEILHSVLYNYINEEATIGLDRLINGKILELELLKEKTKEGVTL